MDTSIEVRIPRDYSGRVTIQCDPKAPPEVNYPDEQIRGDVLDNDDLEEVFSFETDDSAEDDAPPEDASLIKNSPVHNTNFRGVPLTYCGADTSLETLESLYELTYSLAKKGERLQAAVLHEWTGEASIAIALACIPEGSRVPVANADVYAVGTYEDRRGRTEGQEKVLQGDGALAVRKLYEENVGCARTGSISHVDCHPIKAMSKDAPSLDLIYANESTDALELLNAYYPKLARGGLICGEFPDDVRKKFKSAKWQRYAGTNLWFINKQ